MIQKKNVSPTILSHAGRKLKEELRSLSKRRGVNGVDQVERDLHALQTYQIELELQNEALQQAHAELVHSHNRYTDLYDLAPIGYVTINEKNVIMEANLTIAEMLGVDRWYLLGHPLTQFIPAEGQDGYYLYRNQLLKSQKRQTFETRLRNATGIQIDVQLDSVVSASANKNPDQFRVAISDISDRKAVESENTALEGTLRQAQKMQAIGTLAGGIAHEFNNILVVIMGAADLAKEAVTAESRAAPLLDSITQSSERARNLVQQILTFGHKSERKHGRINLGAEVGKALSLSVPSLPTSVEIRPVLDISDCHVLADPAEIHQIVLNLCANGVQAMGDKGVLTLQLERTELTQSDMDHHLAVTPGPYAVLSVTDTGHGIDDATKERIFEPFFTTKPVGQGTGMGLSLVYGILQSYKGGIDVESMIGKGTTVRLYFPISETPAPSQTHQAPVPAIVKGNERILLVDDDTLVASMGKAVLESLGYTVTLQTNSVTAWELFKAEQDAFDLVITDQTMPDLTGEELAEAMTDIQPDIPVIICSGYNLEIDENHAKKRGITAFAQKPLSKKELSRVVRKVLDEKDTSPDSGHRGSGSSASH